LAATHGSGAIFKLNDSTNTLRDISTYVTTVGIPTAADTADVSTLGETYKKYISGLRDATIPLGGIYDVVVDGYLFGRLGGTPAPFEYFPAGTATGNVKYSGSAILTSYDGPSSDVGDANKWSATMQVSGSVTRAVI